VGKGFSAGEESWRAGLGTLRQVVRQELVTRQLAAELTAGRPLRVLDIGCGQGTQVLALARAGHAVTGVDSSTTLLGDLRTALAAETADVRGRVRLVHGEAERLADLVPAQDFDSVLCHGVLMYFADPAPLLTAVAAAVAPGGFASLLVRNGDALAMRPGLLGHWTTAQRAFDDMSYGNRIGVTARADRLAELTGLLAERRLSVETWYGVRVFTDTIASDAPAPAGEELRVLLDCEERAGSTDPYRGVAALMHVIARRVLPVIGGRAAVMPDNDERSSRRRRRLRQAGAWVGAVGVYAAAQGLSAWAAQREAGRGTRPQYGEFERPAFAPPGAVFPLAWSALNLTTASSVWLVWRAEEPAAATPSRAEALAWWGAAVVIRSGYVPLAFGRRQLWAATADAALLSAVMSRYAFVARRVDQRAALLAAPEVAWTAFATALSTAIAAKNVALSRRPGPGSARPAGATGRAREGRYGTGRPCERPR
jgi:S-adenosylmethionine-dependent methyltransferase